jgi:SAM-dependent methyltransferase
MSDSGYDRSNVAEFYDSVVPYRTRKDVEFYTEAARDSAGPVLELGCGTGRILIPIARSGIEVTGLDSSPSMLEICRRRVEQEPVEVRDRISLVEAPMQDFGLDQKFRLATFPFRSFQHLLSVEDQLSCLRYAHAHLSDGGSLILDIYNPSLHRIVEDNLGQVGEGEPEFSMPDGRRVVRKHRTMARDLFNQINEEELIYYVTHPDGTEEQIVDAFPMRYLYRFEAEHLLARCGFEVDTVYADYDRTPYGSHYPGELVILAKKV